MYSLMQLPVPLVYYAIIIVHMCIGIKEVKNYRMNLKAGANYIILVMELI